MRVRFLTNGKIVRYIADMISRFGPQYAQTMLDFLFPAECAACHNFAGDQRIVVFCQSCWNTIRLLPSNGCEQCGKPFAAAAFAGFLCGDCRAFPPAYDRVLSAAMYDGVMKEAIHQFKFSRRFRLGKPLAHLLMAQLDGRLDYSAYHAILPVPLHRSRSKQRGYNQAEILAKEIATTRRLALMTQNLVRARHTAAQWQFNSKRERLKNVKGAFQLRNPEQICGKRLLLIDDIFTTGSTANECAKTLKHAGAEAVVVLTVSRAGLGTASNSDSPELKPLTESPKSECWPL